MKHIKKLLLTLVISIAGIYLCYVAYLLIFGFLPIFAVNHGYAKPCHCYGIDTGASCYGLKTACMGGLKMITEDELRKYNPSLADSMFPSCEPLKDPTIASNAITIDFNKCQNCKQRIGVAFGSTTYQLQKHDDEICQLNYGGEIENPKWDGKLTNICMIPRSLGKKVFNITNYGVNFSDISQYCEELAD